MIVDAVARVPPFCLLLGVFLLPIVGLARLAVPSSSTVQACRLACEQEFRRYVRPGSRRDERSLARPPLEEELFI